MAWAKLDDGMHSHPKFMCVSLGATGLWAVGLSYAADYLTDGLVPRPVAVGRDERADEYAAELVSVGLWDEDPRGWVIHDYLEFNPSRAEVEAGREERSEKAKRAATKRWASKTQSPERARRNAPGNAPGNATSVPGAEQHASSTHPHVYAPDPTRPVPSVSTDVETENARASAPDAGPVETPPAALSLPDDVRAACDDLAAAGLGILDRHPVADLAARYPDVDIRASAAATIRWGRDKKIKHPYNALRSVVEAADAPRKKSAKKAWSGAGDLSRFDRPGVSA